MSDAQMTAIFTNISTHASKVIASNADLSATISSGTYLLGGFILALIVAVTWKG
jgi:hypothetical protein